MFTATLVAGQALAIERHPLRIGPSGAPLAVPTAGGILGPLGWTADGLILVCWAIIMGRQVTRYRRSAGNQRQQLKWLIGGAACCVVATAITIFAGNYSSSAAQAVQDAADLGAAMLPASIGVGIVKYRLYDIDRIFSRTIAYAIVTGLLVGVYLGLVLLASLVRPSSSPAVVAGSTLVVAALFHPLRRRVQRVVDRRFNRARYNADQIVAAFAARLQDAVDLGTVRDELTNAVHAALEPAHLSVWIKEPPSEGRTGYRRGSEAVDGSGLGVRAVRRWSTGSRARGHRRGQAPRPSHGGGGRISQYRSGDRRPARTHGTLEVKVRSS